ncbi:embigin [Marmota monax]|nr:embigin [Marmota monax]
MRAFTGLRGPLAPRASSAWPLLLVCLIAGTPWSLADSDPPGVMGAGAGMGRARGAPGRGAESSSPRRGRASRARWGGGGGEQRADAGEGGLWGGGGGLPLAGCALPKLNLGTGEALACLLGGVNLERVAPDSAFTNLVGEEMMAKYSNLSLEIHSISLTDKSSMLVEKNITLEKPSNMELTCQFTTSGDLNSINITWRKGDELLENNNYLINASGNTLYTQYTFTIINSKQMGSYSCFFEEEKEQKGTFNIKVPELHGKHKPLITYVGDSTVLVCKCEHCFPTNWTWYRSNGSVQVPVDVHMNDKYVISGKHANETRLKIMHLSEEDGGSYWCHAIFQLGESEEHIELVVLSFLVPLKPFLAIIAEVILLVAFILLCEMYTQKKKKHPEEGKEFEQIEQLKSDDSNGIENNAPRHRKIESGNQ